VGTNTSVDWRIGATAAASETQPTRLPRGKFLRTAGERQRPRRHPCAVQPHDRPVHHQTFGTVGGSHRAKNDHL